MTAEPVAAVRRPEDSTVPGASTGAAAPHTCGVASCDTPSTPTRVPEATVARLPLYLRALLALGESAVATVSSDALAAAAGVNSAKVRKDLSQLGSYGIRGVGYDVANLVAQISRQLGLTRPRSVAIIGIGNLGHALAGYGGFAPRGVRVAALLDADARRIGETVNGLVVASVTELEQVVAAQGINIGVIATPAAAAQETADRLMAAGVRSILNFAPVTLRVPAGVDVRKVDLSVELQILSFHEQQRSAAGVVPGAAAAVGAR